MSRLVVVAPLKEGARDQAHELLEQGPPFELDTTPLEQHAVFLTDREVVFLFEGPDVRDTVQRLAQDPGVWRTAAAWRSCLAGRPRLADSAYDWSRAEE